MQNLKPIIRNFIHFMTRLYISEIEVRGLRNLQKINVKHGAIFAGNHPSGLLDPMAVMTALPDTNISTVAKYGLFKAPIVSFFLKVMQSVPVAQPYDPDLPPEKQMPKEERQLMNQEMFDTVTSRLIDGVNVCIFPEGTCHSTPQIKALKVGTARMALQVSKGSKGQMRIPIFPIGITYSVPSGAQFRAKVLIDIGRPVEVTDNLLDMYSSDDRNTQKNAEIMMTNRIERHLNEVTVRVPDWRNELAQFCKHRSLGEPVYDVLRKEKKWYEQQGISSIGNKKDESIDRNTFYEYDLDKDGMLTPEELAKLLNEKLDTNVTTEQAKKMINQFSTGDGEDENTLNLKEYEQMIRLERRKEQCQIKVGKYTFTSVAHYETVAEARKRVRKAKADTILARTSQLVKEMPNIELQRDAARKALFGLANIQPTPEDWDFINIMHLARHIYKPCGAQLTLGQYADLTRSFANVAVRRLDDPEFQSLYKRIEEYGRKLNEIDVTDKYVAMYAKGSDPLNERLTILRTKARTQILTTFLKQPIGMLGGILHSPILALAQIVGTKMGVDEYGDRSVEATMRIVAGLAGILLYYPIVATSVGLYTSSVMSGLATLPVFAISGYTFVHQRPFVTAFTTMKGSLRLLLSKNIVDNLRADRSKLQSDLRAFADKHSPPELEGWWQNPEKYISQIKEKRIKETMDFYEGTQRVTQQSIENARLTSLSIPLHSNKRLKNERAVLTMKQLPGNDKALLWIPGRNDSFFHVHILNRVLNAGFDLFVLDLRRCGRSKMDIDGVTPCISDELLGHDSYDFSEYLEEIDATVSFLKRPTPLSVASYGRGKSTVLTNNIGCGKYYENIVCYAHSTGGLVAAMYGADGSSSNGSWRGAIDGYIFNSPFWSWNLPWYNKFLVDKLDDGMKAGALDPSTIMNSTGGEKSEYSLNLYKTYGFTDELKNTKDLHVTAGWMNAVKQVQNELVADKLVLKKPTLVMSTPADEVLLNDEIESLSQHLVWKEDPHLFSYYKIGTSDEEPSAHDLLAAPSALRVDETMRHIENFLHTNFSNEGDVYYYDQWRSENFTVSDDTK